MSITHDPDKLSSVDNFEDAKETLSVNTVPEVLEEDVGAEEVKSEHDLPAKKVSTDTMSLPHEVFFVITVCAGQLWTQYALGQTISILHIIAAHYSIKSPGTLSWLIAGYSLTVGTFILIFGRMGDVLGWKKMLIIGYCWFAVWSMLAGLAVYSNKVLFIFARVLQGIGPSIILPNSLAIAGASYNPGPRKSMVFSLFGATAPYGTIIGAAFSGIFALRWWPWAFWACAPALALTAIAAFLLIPESVQDIPPKQGWGDTLSALDVMGSCIGVTALVLINFAWNQSGVDSWSAPYVITALILGVLVVPAFFYYEHHHADYPLITMDDITSEVGFVLACLACGWACFGIWFYYIWQFSQLVRGAGPLQATAWMSPICISGTIAAITSGKLLNIIRPAYVMTIALTAFTVGIMILTTCPAQQNYWVQLFFSTIITTWGMDMSFPAGTLILSAAVPAERQGMAASLVNTVVNFSISIALGFAGTVEGHVNNGGATPEDLLKGYRGALYMGIGLGGLGMAVSLLFAAQEYRRDHKRKDKA